MSESGSISKWIPSLQAGDSEAAQRLWGQFVDQLVRLARRRLSSLNRRVADEEDMAISVFDAALRGIRQGRYPKLDDRNDLWQILVMLTERRAIDWRRREKAIKRGRGLVRGESAFEKRERGGEKAGGLSQFVGRECPPEFAAAVGDQLAHQIAALPDQSLRDVAFGKLAGYTNDELAEQLGVSLRAVERKLNLIRRHWKTWVSS